MAARTQSAIAHRRVDSRRNSCVIVSTRRRSECDQFQISMARTRVGFRNVSMAVTFRDLLAIVWTGFDWSSVPESHAIFCHVYRDSLREVVISDRHLMLH